MKNKISLALLIGMGLIWAACTSKQQVADEPVVDTEVVDEQLAQLDESPLGDESDAAFGGDSFPTPEQSLGETPFQEGSIENSEVAAGSAADDMGNLNAGVTSEVPPVDSSQQESNFSDSTSSDTSSSDSFSADSGSAPGESFSSDYSNSDSSSSMAAVDTAAPVAQKPKKELQKIETTPFREGGFLLNAVYIARPKDTFSKISQKIYGNTSRVGDLKAMNPNLQKIWVGAKVYYNSPSRPTDENSLKVYYEDKGQSPSVYMSNKKENLRTKSKEILGFDEAWKEIWSTNIALKSKYQLEPGAEFYYWTDKVKETPILAKNTEVPVLPEPDMSYDDPVPVPTPETNSQQMADASSNMDLPPPPPVEPVFEEPPPPPAPDYGMDVPPPPSQPANPPSMMGSLEQQETETPDDMMMILGAVGILTAGAAALIVIRKRKQQKEAEAMAAMENTHIGSSGT